MRSKLLFFAGILSGLLLPLSGVAQQYYQPIMNGFVYQYIARDSIYSIAGGSINGNTIALNKIVKKGVRRVGTASCLGTSSTYHEQPNNQFGEKIIENPNGDFIFVVAAGTTFPVQEQHFLLKTRVLPGTSWLMNAGANLSATLTGRNVATFCGTSDSVITYNLSDGNQLILSKNYGLVQVPNFTAYVANSDFKKRVLQLYQLPEYVWQNAFNSPFKVFDFQPNDRFSYYRKEANSTFYTEEWYQNKILTRRNSPGGDSIYYTLEHQKLSRSGHAFNPNLPPGPFTLVPPVIQNLIITETTNPELSVLTNEFFPGSTFFNSAGRAQVNVAIKKQSRYHQREVLQVTDYAYVPASWQNCGNTFYYAPDSERYIKYGFGLGKVYDFSIDSWPMLTWDSLQAYVKGSETYGTWPQFSQLMSTSEALEPVGFSAFPNPFSSELILTFSPTFKSESTTVLIQNSLGQEVYRKEIKPISTQNLKLDLPDLSKGLYILRAVQNGKTYTTRLIKD